MSFFKSIKKLFNSSPEENEIGKMQALQRDQADELERTTLRKRHLSDLKEGAEEYHLYEKIQEFIDMGDAEYLGDALEVFQLDFSQKQEEYWGRLCLSDDGTLAKVFIDKKALTATFEDSMPLVIAAREGNLKMAEFLLPLGVDKNAWGGAPLIVSASNRHMKFAEFLIEKGCDPEPLKLLQMYTEAAAQVKCSTVREKMMSNLKSQFVTLKQERERMTEEAKIKPAAPKAP